MPDAHGLAAAAARAWFEPGSIDPLGQGHIHRTYRVTDASNPGASYVLQQINASVYQDIDLLTAQTQLVLGALTDNPDYIEQYQVPQLMMTIQGAFVVKHAGQEAPACWRMWRFVDGSATFDPPQNRQQIYLAGQAFGAYQRGLQSLQPHQLKHTIPDFLHLPAYLAQFDAVLQQSPAEELSQAKHWVELVQNHRRWPEELNTPNALIHGDCKINNVLFDRAGRRVLAIIDLDNNMHGHWAWDFGDLVRSVAFSRGGFNPEDYRACVQGFVAGRGQQKLDLGCLVSAPAYLAYMLGVRFLTDHLNGDQYFAVPRHGDNLQRAQQQLALFGDFQAQAQVMADIVAGELA